MIQTEPYIDKHGLESAPDEASPDRAASLGALDAHGLAALRAIILTVIDDGDPQDGSPEPIWVLYNDDEVFVNEQRLRFCDAIQQAIVERAAPATTAKGERQ